MGVDTVSATLMGGSFTFDERFTSNNGVGGHELASVLLGAPVSGWVPYNDGPFEWFTKYYGAYIQDDWRVSQKLTVNFGVRFEHEDGLREVENRQAVAFDESVVSPLNSTVPKTGLLAGRTINGGLIFAGVDGAPEEQGDPAAIKIAPRGGFSYSLNTNTVLRGGYGLFYAPWNYSRAQHGQAGFTRDTSMNQSDPATAVPLSSLENPFPGGLIQPIGSALGLLTNTGGIVRYVDQNKGNPKVHQYSFDVQRELPGNMAVTIGYIGATGRDIGYFGTPAMAIPRPSTSTRSIRRWPARPSPVRTGRGTPRPCAPTSPTRSSGFPAPASSAPGRRFRPASCCGRSRSSATSSSTR